MLNDLKQIKNEMREKFNAYSKNVNWIVFVLIVCFTTGSWLGTNGISCEMPIMVHDLPEGWRLPSILGMILQFSQIGVFIFMTFNYFAPKHVSLVGIIYFIFSIGLVSYFPLAFLWNKTFRIGDKQRSIWLYVFTFTLGVLDSTSTVTFLPYIGKYYTKEYIISNGIGETLAAMIPSLLALAQGIGSDSEVHETCIKYANGTMSMHDTNEHKEPRITITWFFIALFMTLILSFVSFTVLHFGKIGKQNRKREQVLESQVVPKVSSDFDTLSYTSFSSLLDSQTHTIVTSSPISSTNKETQLSIRDIYLLQSVNFLVSILVFGIFPGIQSYATLPYGKTIYFITINLTNILLPFIVFLTIISFNITNARLLVEFSCGLLLTIYILLVSYMSPCPFLLETSIGPLIITVCWITTFSLFIRIRCLIATKLEISGHGALINFGILTSIGQILGGIVTYLVVNVYEIFDNLPSCKTSHEYCFN